MAKHRPECFFILARVFSPTTLKWSPRSLWGQSEPMRQECVVLQLCEARFLCSSVAVLHFSAARASVVTVRRQVERSLQLARDSQVLGFRLQGLCGTRPWGSIWNASSVPFNRALAMTAALHTVAAIFRHPGDMAGHLNLAFCRTV